MEITKEVEEKTMEFILLSLIHHVNTLEITSDEREDVLNIVFNVLSNSLYPDARLYFNEAIFDKVEKIKKMDEGNIDNTLKNMGLR